MFLTGGCGKADNRTVLHSESSLLSGSIGSEYMMVKHGVPFHIRKASLAQVIKERFSEIKRVFDIRDESPFLLGLIARWYIIFSVETKEGHVYTGFKCTAKLTSDYHRYHNPYVLELKDCETDDAGGIRLDESSIRIDISDIYVRLSR